MMVDKKRGGKREREREREGGGEREKIETRKT
jgi:hypothetical protein